MDLLRSATEPHSKVELSGPTLWGLARAAILHALGGPPVVVPDGEVYRRLAATFVTVLLDGQVHGCIGVLEPIRTLAEDVQHNAVAAALHDPRSRALRRDELAVAKIEISVLSALQQVEVCDEADAAQKLRPGIDGVVLRCGAARATFLPQVWEKLPRPSQFLTELRRKAGLSHWPSGLCVYRYSVQKYEEIQPANEAAEHSETNVTGTAESAPLVHA